MAIFKQLSYAKTGTEYDFWQGILDIITDLDSNIRIEDASGNLTTVEAQLENRSSSYKAAFYLNFGNGIIYRLQRGYANNNRNDQIGSFDAGGGQNSYWWDGSFAIDDIGTRKTGIAYIKSPNFTWFGLCPWNGNVSGVGRSAARLTVGNEVYAKSVQYNVPINNVVFNGRNSAVTFASFFTYASPAGELDYLNKAIFMSGGQKAFETEDILTCSNVSTFSTLSFNGRSYLAIGPNALIELTDEEETE